METREYRFVDKSQWDRGPWDNEPDKVQWQDVATGLPCIARRNEISGFWCGYVGVAEGHPYFEHDYNDDLIDVACHGGLTFSGHCAKEEKEHAICHVPAAGEPDNVWWFGFDCCHAYDYAPGLAATIKKVGCTPWHEDVYRDLAYVKNQCADLAQQLAAVYEQEAPKRA